MSDWNDGKCMATKKQSSDRCCGKTITQDFCKHHCEKHEYDAKVLETKFEQYGNDEDILNECIKSYIGEFDKRYCEKIKQLDEDYSHGLMGMSSSWSEVPMMYRIYISKTWWDIRTLLNTIAFQLNQSEYEKPYPMFPENPYTRTKISISDIVSIKKRIKKLCKYGIHVDVNVAVKIFVNQRKKNLRYLRKIEDPYIVAITIIDEFADTLRYKIINYTNSQGCYCGYWVKKDEKKTQFEQNFSIFKSMYFTMDNIIMPNRDTLKALNYIRTAKKDDFPF